MKPVDAYIGLGSNLQQPQQQIQRAFGWLASLADSELTATSRLYRSAPIGPQDQPDFINAAACLTTRLAPLALLDALQELEQRAGRIKTRHWGERSLDLDILLYADEEIHTPRLQVPHRELTQRAFVLRPLIDIKPTLALPDGRQISTLLSTVADQVITPL